MWCASFSADGCPVLSGFVDETVRILNADMHEKSEKNCWGIQKQSVRCPRRWWMPHQITWVIAWKSEKIQRSSQNDVDDEEKRSESDTIDAEDAFKKRNHK